MAQVNYSSNGLVYITKSTFSAVSNVSIDNCFSADYSQYKIIADMTISTDTYASIRLRAGGTDNSASNYNRQDIYANGASATGSRATYTSFLGVFSPRSYSSIAYVEILNPFQSTYTSLFSYKTDSPNGASIALIMASNGTTVTTSYDGFTVIPNSGTISGTIYVYGYKES